MSAIFGVIGVLLGLLLGSAFTFWVTYRAELANALVAVIAIVQALQPEATRPSSAQGTGRAPPVSTPSGRAAANDRSRGSEQLDKTWREHRGALGQVMKPEDFWTLAGWVTAAGAAPHEPAPAHLVTTLGEIHEILWHAHERFILRVFVRMGSSKSVTKQISSEVSKHPR